MKTTMAASKEVSVVAIESVRSEMESVSSWKERH